MQLHGDDLELSDAELSRKTHLSNPDPYLMSFPIAMRFATGGRTT